jgi:hypothetical protein
MTARRTVALLVALCLIYSVLIGWRGVLLLDDDRWVVRGLGIGVLLLPVVGIWLIIGEVRFGRDTERLARELGEEPDELAKRPSGRVDRAAADELFEQRRQEVEAAPAEWRCWFRLGAAYGAAGDPGRGRKALRKAIALHDDTAITEP